MLFVSVYHGTSASRTSGLRERTALRYASLARPFGVTVPFRLEHRRPKLPEQLTWANPQEDLRSHQRAGDPNSTMDASERHRKGVRSTGPRRDVQRAWPSPASRGTNASGVRGSPSSRAALSLVLACVVEDSSLGNGVPDGRYDDEPVQLPTARV